MLAHAIPKLTGGMPGFQHSMAFVSGLGIPGWMAGLSWFAELAGGAALILGVFTRFFAATILIDMLVATLKVHLKNGLRGPGGYEFTMTLAVIAFTLILLGSGPISLEWLFERKKGF
jgi:putative oxidoreductase